jgi:hypothetical protein
MITFAGGSKQYTVTTGIAAPGTIVIAAPGLVQALPAAATALSIVPASFYLLKTSVDIATVTSSNTTATDAWGAVGIAAQYDNIGATYGALTNSETNKLLGAATQVLSGSTSGTAWSATGAGIPELTGTGGTNLFGNDLLYDKRQNELCPIAGGPWGYGAGAGVWALLLSHNRVSSNAAIGLRSALYL